MHKINLKSNMAPVEGIFEILRFSGVPPKLSNGKLLFDTRYTKIIDSSVTKNKITSMGRAQLAAMLSGQRPPARIGKIEIGVGAYGLNVQVDPRLAPPDPTGEELTLNVPMSPKLEIPISVEDVITPPNNPMARVFTAILSPIPSDFDTATYFGISEFALKVLGTSEGETEYPEFVFAIKRRVPIQPESESSIAIRWTIQF